MNDALYSEYDGRLKTVDVLRQMHRFDEALDLLKGDASRQATALRLRVLRSAGREDRALRILAITPVDDDDVELRANRIAVLDRLHRYTDLNDLILRPSHRALRDLDDPMTYRIRLAEARALASQGRLTESAQQFDAIAARKDTATVNGWRLSVWMRLGHNRQARHLAVELASHTGKDEWRWKATAGRALYRLGNSDLAIATLREAIDQCRCYPHSWRWLATTLRAVGDFPEAERVLDEAATVQVPVPAPDGAGHTRMLPLGEHPSLLVERALLHLARFDGTNPDRLTSAMSVANHAFQQYPDCGEALWAKARILRAIGDRNAIAELRRLTQVRARGVVNVRIELGHALADLTLWSDALEQYDAALAAHPRNREALLGQVTVRARQTPPTGTVVRTAKGQVPDRPPFTAAGLGDAVTKLAELLSQDADILNIAGERLAQAGHYDHADRLFRAVISGSQDHSHDLSYAGAIRAWAWARDFTKARSVVDAAKTASTGENGDGYRAETPIIRIAEGMLLGDQGRFVEANKLLAQLWNNTMGRPDADLTREDAAAVAIWLSTSHRWLFEYDAALTVMEAALAQSHTHHPRFTRAADLHDEMGWTYFGQRKFSAAEASFHRALDSDPRHSGALRGLVQVCRATGDFAGAEATARRGLTLNPLDTNMLCELAWLYGEAGQVRQAQSLLDDALDRECANIHALEWRIIYLIREGRLEDACAAAAHALLLRPESPGIVEAACTAQLRRGDASRARAIATAAWEQRRDDYQFTTVAAEVHEQAGGSEQHWRAWVNRLAPLSASPAAAHVRASLLRHHDQIAEAMSVVTELLPAVDWPDLQALRAEILFDEDRADEALHALLTLHERAPWEYSVVRRIAMAYVNRGDFAVALDFTEEAISSARAGGDPEPVELLVLYGEVLLRVGRFDEALDVASRAKLNRTHHIVESRVLEIDALGSRGDVDRALELATSLYAERPGSRRARLMLARCQEAVGRGREAADVLHGCEVELPRYPHTIVIASWIKRDLGDLAEASALVESTLREFPGDAGLRAERGWILLEQHKHADARKAFSVLMDATSRHERALGHTGHGWCHLRETPPNARAALVAFEEATRLDPQQPEAYLGASVANRVLAGQARRDDVRKGYLIKSFDSARLLLNVELTASSCRTIGRAAFELREMGTAYRYLDRSLQLNKYRGDRAGMGVLLLRQGRTEKALATLVQGIEVGSEDADLLATLGAAYLDRALRENDKGADAHLALRYLRDAYLRQSDDEHLFAIHNLATTLAFLGDLRAAEHLLSSTIDAMKPRAALGVDVNDVPLLQLHLAELLRQPRPKTNRAARLRRADALQARADRDGRDRLVADFLRERQLRPRAPIDESAAETRWQRRAGYGFALAALALFMVVWTGRLFAVGIDRQVLTPWFMVAISCVLLGAAFAGISLPRIERLRLGAVEISSFVELSQIARDIDLPESVLSPLGFGRIDSIRMQWITPWRGDTLLPRLGPAVGPLINTYYAHRDAFLPWRRL